MKKLNCPVIIVLFAITLAPAQKYTDAEGKLRVALVKQPRYPKASAIGFATIPPTDEGGLSIAALNRMIEGTIKGLQLREARHRVP